MKQIWISSIPYEKQRYRTVGDWYESSNPILGKFTRIDVSEMSDERYEILVAIHELVEKVLCDKTGITEKQVDDFDMSQHEYENIRLTFPEDFSDKCRYCDKKESEHFDEPGNDPRAPYHKQHKIAEIIERLLAIELDVNWEEYEKEINSL
jgi:hypothetical protein